MSVKKQFEKVLLESINMALATSVDKSPNVRVVTFAYDPEKAGRLFFTTFKGNKKIHEFAQNPQVACFMLPAGPQEDVQVRIFGTVQKSDVQLDEVVEIIARKFPDSAETIKQGGPMIEVYEVNFSEAFVTVGINSAEKISI